MALPSEPEGCCLSTKHKKAFIWRNRQSLTFFFILHKLPQREWRQVTPQQWILHSARGCGRRCMGAKLLADTDLKIDKQSSPEFDICLRGLPTAHYASAIMHISAAVSLKPGCTEEFHTVRMVYNTYVVPQFFFGGVACPLCWPICR